MHRCELVLIPIRIYVYRKLYRGTWAVDASQYVSTCRAPFALSFVLAGKCQVFIVHSQIHFISFLVDRLPALFAYVEYTIDLKQPKNRNLMDLSSFHLLAKVLLKNVLIVSRKRGEKFEYFYQSATTTEEPRVPSDCPYISSIFPRLDGSMYIVTAL